MMVPTGSARAATTMLDRIGWAAKGVALCWRYRIANSAARPPDARAAASMRQGRVRRAKGAAYSLRMVNAVLIVIDCPGRIQNSYGKENCTVMFAPVFLKLSIGVIVPPDMILE